MIRAVPGVLLALPLCLTLAAAVPAQAPDCDYDRCALWVGSNTAVQGAQGIPVGFGMWAPRVAPLETTLGTVRRHYEASRRYVAISHVLSVGYLATALVMITHYYGENRRRWDTAGELALPVSVVGIGMVGTATIAKAHDHLRQAIWLFNRALPRAKGTVTSDCPYDRCALRLQPGMWSTRIVRGADAMPVARTDARAPAADLFAAAGDSARAHYDAFRSARNELSGHATWRRITTAAAIGGFLLPAVSNGEAARTAGIGLLAFGYVVGHLGIHGYTTTAARAATNLEQAIWFYNRTLPASP